MTFKLETILSIYVSLLMGSLLLIVCSGYASFGVMFMGGGRFASIALNAFAFSGICFLASIFGFVRMKSRDPNERLNIYASKPLLIIAISLAIFGTNAIAGIGPSSISLYVGLEQFIVPWTYTDTTRRVGEPRPLQDASFGIKVSLPDLTPYRPIFFSRSDSVWIRKKQTGDIDNLERIVSYRRENGKYERRGEVGSYEYFGHWVQFVNKFDKEIPEGKLIQRNNGYFVKLNSDTGRVERLVDCHNLEDKGRTCSHQSIVDGWQLRYRLPLNRMSEGEKIDRGVAALLKSWQVK